MHLVCFLRRMLLQYATHTYMSFKTFELEINAEDARLLVFYFEKKLKIRVGDQSAPEGANNRIPIFRGNI